MPAPLPALFPNYVTISSVSGKDPLLPVPFFHFRRSSIMPNSSKWTMKLILALLIVSLFTAACGSATPVQPPAMLPTATIDQANTPIPSSPATATVTIAATDTQAPASTATPQPPTATPLPSATPNLDIAEN